MQLLKDGRSISAKNWESRFESFYNENLEHLLRYAYSITGDKELSEDIVSDVFMGLWDKKSDLAQVQQIQDMGAYLARVVRNLAYKKISRKVVEQSLDVDDPGNYFNEIDPQQILLGKELESIINRIIQNLTPHGSLVYDMARNKGYSNDRIAKELGISKHTVRKHLSIVLKEFREALSSRFSDSGEKKYFVSKYISVFPASLILFWIANLQ